jgi:murein DD-endopeptidase MepM/ murein hydrolase activator NlpD
MITFCALEAVTIVSLLAGGPAPGAEPVHWRAPVDGPVQVLRPFRAPLVPYGPGHRGVDLAAEPGATVHAAAAGTVSFAGQIANRGVVVLRHPDGSSTEYEPVTAQVHRGDQLLSGGTLGSLSAPDGHCGTVSCLHWGMRRNNEYVDPIAALNRPADVILLPFLGPRTTAPVTASVTVHPSPRAWATGPAAAAGLGALAVAAVPAVAARRRFRLPHT